MDIVANSAKGNEAAVFGSPFFIALKVRKWPVLTVHDGTSDRLCRAWERQVTTPTLTNRLILYKN